MWGAGVVSAYPGAPEHSETLPPTPRVDQIQPLGHKGMNICGTGSNPSGNVFLGEGGFWISSPPVAMRRLSGFPERPVQNDLFLVDGLMDKKKTPLVGVTGEGVGINDCLGGY